MLYSHFFIKMSVALSVMRLLAIFLIVNSHIGELYPDCRFAVGGHLGNSIFFFASGFGLLLSCRLNPLRTLNWYRKRFSSYFSQQLFSFYSSTLTALRVFSLCLHESYFAFTESVSAFFANFNYLVFCISYCHTPEQFYFCFARHVTVWALLFVSCANYT